MLDKCLEDLSQFHTYNMIGLVPDFSIHKKVLMLFSSFESLNYVGPRVVKL